MPAQTSASESATAMPALLRQHLTGWAGGLPAADQLRVVASARNAEHGWDGRPQLLTGIADPAGRPVGAVAPAAAALLAHHQGPGGAPSLGLLPGVLGKAGHTVDRV